MKKYIKIITGISLLNCTFTGNAQQLNAALVKKEIGFNTYMERIVKHNLPYSAEKFNVNIADAEIIRSKTLPDAALSFEVFDNGELKRQMGYGFSGQLSWTLELGGKRKARIEVAHHKRQISHFLLENFLRNLRADASLAYLKAMLSRYLLDIHLHSYQQMKNLAEIEVKRLGTISKDRLQKSNLGIDTLLNEVYAAQITLKIALSNLSLFLGEKQKDTLLLPKEHFSCFQRNFALKEMILTAQNNRSDLKAAWQHTSVYQGLLKLAKANKIIDLGLSAGLEYNAEIRNFMAPTPSFTRINTGISIPIKFSSSSLAAISEAQYGLLQAEKLYQQAELNLQAEVTQAFYHYEAAQKQAVQFESNPLIEAKASVVHKAYSYQKGTGTLSEVLNAQRNYNQLQQNYYQTLYNHAVTLIELERAVGIWDISL